MSTISPVIGAPNSFTAIDEAFVTSELIEEDDKGGNEKIMKTTTTTTPIQPQTQSYFQSIDTPQNQRKTIEIPTPLDKAKEEGLGVPDIPNKNDALREKYETSPEIREIYKANNENPQQQPFSPGYFQRALNMLKGRRNSDSYRAEATLFGDSAHAKSLGIVKVREVDPAMERAYNAANTVNLMGHPGTRERIAPKAPYNIYGSNHPSVVGEKGDVNDSIITDFSRGYHHAVDSLKHYIGLEKPEHPSANMVKINPLHESLPDSAKPIPDGPEGIYSNELSPSRPYFNHPSLTGEYSSAQQPPVQHKSTLEELNDKEFPLLL